MSQGEGSSALPLGYADRPFDQLFRFEMPNTRQAVLAIVSSTGPTKQSSTTLCAQRWNA